METSRRERKKHEKRVMILKAAETLFKEKGISAVSLEEIADAVDISRGTIYNHFHSKDSLVKSLLDPFLNHHKAFMQELDAQPVPTSLDLLLKMCIKLWENHRNVFQLLEQNDLNKWPELKDRHQSMVQDFCSLFERVEVKTLKFQDQRIVAQIVLKLFQPFLDSIENHPERDALFVESMKDLLLKKSS